MAKIKRISSNTNNVKQVKKTGSSSFTHPALRSEFGKTKLLKESKAKQTLKSEPPQTFAETMEDIKLSLKYLDGGSRIDSILKNSTLDRRQRAKTQLNIFMVKALKKDVFKFIAKSSGLGVAKSYQVDIMFSDAEILAKTTDKTSKEIFNLSNVKLQCSCDDFKYRYRYIATKGNFVIGVKQYIFPKVTNKRLKGTVCKHTILVLEKIKKGSFQKIFERYINNKRINKRTRIKVKDTLSTLQSSAKSKIK